MSPNTATGQLPLTLPLALPAGAVVFIVVFKTRPLTEAGVLALAVFFAVLFTPGLLKAGAKGAAKLVKPKKKKEKDKQ